MIGADLGSEILRSPWFQSKFYTHIHLFMLGRNKYGENLTIKDPTKREMWWPQDAKIEVIYQQKGAIDYVIRKNMPDDQYELLSPYGMKHLKRNFWRGLDRYI